VSIIDDLPVQRLEGVFEPSAYGVPVPKRDVGEWSVIMLNTDPLWCDRAPYAYRGLSRKSARKQMNYLINYIMSYDGQFEKISPYAWLCDGRHGGHFIIAMTDQVLSIPVRELKIGQLPL
jgi:hypothetical protein